MVNITAAHNWLIARPHPSASFLPLFARRPHVKSVPIAPLEPCPTPLPRPPSATCYRPQPHTLFAQTPSFFPTRPSQHPLFSLSSLLWCKGVVGAASTPSPLPCLSSTREAPPRRPPTPPRPPPHSFCPPPPLVCP
jgi:hypothetical protein